MKIEAKTEIKQIMEIENKDTGKISFLVENNGEWKLISKEEYYQILGSDEIGEQ